MSDDLAVAGVAVVILLLLWHVFPRQKEPEPQDPSSRIWG